MNKTNQDYTALFETLDGSHLLVYTDDLGLLFAWNGSQTCNIFSAYTGEEVDIHMTSDPLADTQAAREWLEWLIEEHRKEWQEREYNVEPGEVA